MIKKALALTLALSCFASAAFAQEREESMVMSAGDSLLRKVNFTFFSIASVTNMRPRKEAKSARSLGSYNYIGINHKLNSDRKVSLRLPFLYQTAGINEHGDQEKQEIQWSDVHVAYSIYDLGYIGDVDMTGNIKLYLPTSKYSAASNLIAKLRFETYFEYSIGRFSSITYAVKPDIYFQQRTAYFNSEIPQFNDGNYVTDPRQTTKQFSLEHYVEVVADLNKYFSLKPKAGFDEDWYHSSAVEELEGRHITKAKFGLGLEVRPVRGLTFTVGMQNEASLNPSRGKDVAFFLPENTQYSVMTNAFLF